MKLNGKTIGIAMIAGAALLYILKPKQQVIRIPASYNPNQVPPQPPQQNSPQWQNWVNLVIGTYGAVAWLWQPGGPFYKVPTGNVYDALPNPGAYNWNDPNSLPGGIG